MIQGIHVVKKTRRDGQPLWYVYAYRGGPQIHRHEGWQRPRLKSADVRKWMAAAEDRCEKIAASATTLADLINLWRPSSPDWKALATSTQRTWGSALKAIEAKWGKTPLTVWNDPRMASKVIDWRDSRSETPRTADFGVVVLRALLKFGRLRGKVSINAAEGIPNLYHGGNRAEIIWTERDMAAFAQASTKLELLYQCAVSLTQVGDSQGANFLIRWSKRKEACDGGSDWGSFRLHIGRFAVFCAKLSGC